MMVSGTASIDRQLLTELIERLNAGGARIVGLGSRAWDPAKTGPYGVFRQALAGVTYAGFEEIWVMTRTEVG